MLLTVAERLVNLTSKSSVESTLEKPYNRVSRSEGFSPQVRLIVELPSEATRQSATLLSLVPIETWMVLLCKPSPAAIRTLDLARTGIENSPLPSVIAQEVLR